MELRNDAHFRPTNSCREETADGIDFPRPQMIVLVQLTNEAINKTFRHPAVQ